ncbi:hydrolase [Nocardioides lentus]|uniref:Hydrolase n=1 Tax=Nocardioides lentus TaxID=338077 RepID=A0ABP5AH74_9ACTN
MRLRPLRTTSVLTSLAAVLGASAAAAALGLGAAPASAAPDRGPDRGPGVDTEVVAHRGSSGVAPENTLASARQALRDRADEIENDVQRSADGVLVLMHDTTLARTTDAEQVFPGRAPWNVGDFTLRELRRLDAGSWFGPEYAGERIPTLAEWGRVVGNRADVLIEMKSPSLYPGIARDLDRALAETPFRTALRRDRLVVQSFEIDWLRAYEQASPAVPKGLLYGTRPTPQQIADAAGWTEWVNPSFRVIEESDVDAVQAAGLRIGVYTVNTGVDMRRLVRWGVDAIITDYPQVLRSVLGR